MKLAAIFCVQANPTLATPSRDYGYFRDRFYHIEGFIFISHTPGLYNFEYAFPAATQAFSVLHNLLTSEFAIASVQKGWFETAKKVKHFVFRPYVISFRVFRRFW